MSEHIPEIIDNKYVIVKDYNKGIEYKNKEFRDLAMLYKEKDKEIERLNNIIKRMEEDLREMYITFGEFNEEYTEKKIKELKEGK